MLSWVLNTFLLFEDFLNVFLFWSILHYKTLEICYFFKLLYFFQFIKHAIKHLTDLIIKPFDLLNTIPWTRTKGFLTT